MIQNIVNDGFLCTEFQHHIHHQCTSLPSPRAPQNMASVPLRMLEFGPDMQAQELEEEWGKGKP